MPPDAMPAKGPRSPEAKAKVSRNALVHGLTAGKHVLLDHEDPAAFAALTENVLRDLAPVGAVEIGYAKHIALCLWRLDRAGLVESAAMNHALQDTLAVGTAEFTPAQRFERALIASVNNDYLEPVNRYQTHIQRSLSSALRELQARQASRLLGLPVSPGALRVSLPSTLPARRGQEQG